MKELSDPVLLDNVTHKNLRVITRSGKAFGDSVNLVPVFPPEFGDVQREYPILLRKEKEGGYQALALLGFDVGENLFLEGDRWQASYIPGVIARGPFMIGFQQWERDGELLREPVIHVDMNSPRIRDGGEEGEPVFLPYGGNSPYLERIAAILRAIHQGVTVSKTMYAALESLGLIEPVNIQIEIHRDQHYDLQGYFTIADEKLAELRGDALEELNRAGFLGGAFLLRASLNNVKKLIEMKRRKIIGRTSGG
ncbi:SapC family protein [Microbulbifer thermotolerans]|uniref:SapC family protein n=1 Tax=Microbulbifer thermotolerans TaxID=252514 RepID=UPI000A985492|nr:SapC family protein [Microbulbifer thermotolerans]